VLNKVPRHVDGSCA